MSPRTKACVAFAISVLQATPASADTDDLEALLSESVITTASTSAETASSAPATSVTLTAEDLRIYGIRSIDEAINFLALGVVTSRNLRTPDIGARGVLLPGDNGKHFLLLVNGHAINDPLYGAARFDQGAGIPLDVIDRIEVIIGPGSVLYGSNAMLGVVNVITKNAKEYAGVHALGEYEIARSVRAGAGTGFTFDLFGQQAELTLSAEYFQRFGPDLTFDEQPPYSFPGTGRTSTYRRGGPADGIWGGTVSRAYFMEAPSGALRLRVGDVEVNVMASSYRRGIPYTTADTNVDFDDPESYELDRAVRLDVKHHATLSSLLQLTSRVYADSFDYQRRVNRNAVDGCFQSAFETCQYYAAGLSRWAGIEERLSFNWLSDMSLVTLLGVDARMRWVSAKEDALDFDTGQPFAPTAGRIDDSAVIVSPYVQQTYNPARWIDINAGARLDADERFSPIVSPRGALALHPFDKTTVKGVYSQAFRGPTWNETDSSGFRQARSQDIEPEIVRSVEGSIEQRFSTQRVTFGVFRTWWNNLVEPRVLSGAEVSELQQQGELPITATNVIQFRNVSSLVNYGWNGRWEGTLSQGRLRYGVNATAAYSRRESAGVSRLLPVSPSFFGNARVAYALGGDWPTPALAVSYMGDRLVDRAYIADYGYLPFAPPLAEFRATLTGPVPAVTGVSYRLSGAYATASHGPYAAGNSPGRTYPLPEATVAPIDQYTLFLGLRYDFMTGESL